MYHARSSAPTLAPCGIWSFSRKLCTRTMKRSATVLLFCLIFSFGVPPGFAQEEAESQGSVQINMQNDTPVVGDFTVGPARVILPMAPGGERTVEIQLTNREGSRASFNLSTEDFSADAEHDWTPTFYESTLEGPYPARTWIEPEVDRLELRHGERAFIRVTVRVPQDAEPGDHQAALIATRDVTADGGGGFTVVSRVAALFIISVEGDIVQEGYVDQLTTQRYFNWFLPVRFSLSARNLGTVHMIPSGAVDVRNIFGITVDEIPFLNWVILRESSRTKEFEWQPRFALGYYRAVTDLKAFDGRALAPVSTSFWVIPLLPVLVLLFLIFLVSFIVQYFFARFEIRRKDEDEAAAAQGKPKKKAEPKA